MRYRYLSKNLQCQTTSNSIISIYQKNHLLTLWIGTQGVHCVWYRDVSNQRELQWWLRKKRSGAVLHWTLPIPAISAVDPLEGTAEPLSQMCGAPGKTSSTNCPILHRQWVGKIRETIQQGSGSERKEEEKVLQVGEQRFPCRLWRGAWWS